MELFFFDIETVGNYKNYQEFETLDYKGSSLFRKKYEKMKWDETQTIDEAYINNSGIISTYGKVVCISFGYIKNDGSYFISSIYGDDEKEIVQKFNNLLLKVEKKNFSLSGFRIQNFDIPWVLHKLHKYDIIPANILYTYDKKPWEMRVVDIANDWKQMFNIASTFDEVCYELGIESPKSETQGSNINELYYNGDMESIVKYCEKDVKSSIDVAKKIYKHIEFYEK